MRHNVTLLHQRLTQGHWALADQVLTVSSLALVMPVIVARRDIKVKLNYLP
jgi:hypothetical protein